MLIAERLRTLRQAKKLSQGDIEKRTGLHRCYISRLENGHTVPEIPNLEKIARALEMPLYALLYEGEEAPEIPKNAVPEASTASLWGSSGKEARMLSRFRQLISRLSKEDRRLLLLVAHRIARLRARRPDRKATSSADQPERGRS